LSPGRLNLPTSPALTGSPPILNTIGMVAVADFAASPEGSLRPPRWRPFAVSPALPFFDIEWGGVRLRIDQQQDPALLFRCLT
jgi:hypothetical protein